MMLDSFQDKESDRWSPCQYSKIGVMEDLFPVFDATCPGFVRVSKDIALGAAIYPISNPTGLPSQITIFIFKDINTSNWWVNYGEKINIGYWPKELFSLLSYHAETVQ